MKNTKPNAELVWKQFEDSLVPRLRLSVNDRAVYSHLLRHSRLEGRGSIHFSIAWLSRGARLSDGPTRLAVRRLQAHGALRLVERSRAGHVMEVCLPDEIPAMGPGEADSAGPNGLPEPVELEQTDFLQSKELRKSIHDREGGVCFYCLRRVPPHVRCLDHVIPQARSGRNTYRNLVSSCLECNSQKGASRADDFLRSLYRDRRITAAELTARLSALDALAAGKLRPALAVSCNPLARKGRRPLNPAA